MKESRGAGHEKSCGYAPSFPLHCSSDASSAIGCITAPVVATEPSTKSIISLEVPTRAIDKVDILFAIDNSLSMGDKQQLLKDAVPDLLGRLLVPNCVDPKDRSRILGASTNGTCAAGVVEFEPIKSLHVGVVSSSLGGAGSDTCREGFESRGVRYDMNDRAHLLSRTPSGPAPNAGAGFLAWAPGQDTQLLEGAFADRIVGVREYGCGFEAQLESWYRFLVQPDPYLDVVRRGDRNVFEGHDDELLRQRREFLRPDSLVVVVQITDENDSYVDPQAMDGQAWRMLQETIQLPKPTSACATDPASESCSSCFYPENNGSRAPAECREPTWPLGHVNNTHQIRLLDPKRRFGLDPRYPVRRYVDGLTKAQVPDRSGEHPRGMREYVGEAKCTNPLFAASLPASSKEEMCKLPVGKRSADMVFFAAIAGVPHQLLHFDPASPKNSRLTEADWTKMLGADPARHDLSGIDPHMRESADPRPGLAAPGAADNADPVHGREWTSGGKSLQYACTFDLPLAMQKDCQTSPETCDCSPDPSTGVRPDVPLCDARDRNRQIRAKAYPGVRHLEVAKALGGTGIVSSICPMDTGNPARDNLRYGYRPAAKTIVDTLGARLRSACFPRKLKAEEGKTPPCVVLFEHDTPGDESVCDHPDQGFSRVKDPEVLEPFYRRQIAEGKANARSFPVCRVQALVPAQGASCETAEEAGWCYVSGATALEASGGLCASAIQFSAKVPKQKGTMHLVCVQSEL